MAERWFVAQTQPGRERFAAWHVGNQGFDYFLPEVTTRSVRTALLFPGYLFVSFDPRSCGWQALNNTRGLHHLLPLTTERPDPVRPGYVEDLRARADSGEFDYRAAAEVSLGYAPGDEATVIAGTMAGHVGVFQWQREDRVRLLFSLLGRKVGVTMATEQVAVKHDFRDPAVAI